MSLEFRGDQECVRDPGQGTGAGRDRSRKGQGFPARIVFIPARGAILLRKGQLRKPGKQGFQLQADNLRVDRGGRDLVEPIRAHGGPPRGGFPHYPAAGRLGAVALLGSRFPQSGKGCELCSQSSGRGRDLPRSSSIELQSQAGPRPPSGLVTGILLRTGGACRTNPADGVLSLTCRDSVSFCEMGTGQYLPVGSGASVVHGGTLLVLLLWQVACGQWLRFSAPS